jgi:superfamily II DNA or RNA helicase
VLPESKRFDILLGYFSSSAIRVLALGFAKFIAQGGRARFIINHILSEQDKEAILNGEQYPESVLDFAVSNYKDLKVSLDSEGIHFFNCLAWLIASKRVEIVAVRPKVGDGIAHQKTGIFSDGQNEVLFDGSCNFTAMALLGNIEKLSARFSWDNSVRDGAAIAEQKAYFNAIFDKKADFVEYLDIRDLETAIKTDFGNKDLDELLIDEITLLAKWQEKVKTNLKFKKRLETLEKELQIMRNTPRFPFDGGARPYQVEAYNKWLDNGQSGIFAMATGTGKTITALNCVLEEYIKKETCIYQVVVLVPTIDLAEQWDKEAKKFNIQAILKVTSKTDWQTELSNIVTLTRFGGTTSFFIICSYASFTKQRFQNYFQQLPKETILIADEAHNMGSTGVLNVLPTVHLHKRIGLSATPQRIYDTEGTAIVEAFFKDTAPYIYNFSVERAIKEGYLCEYRYFPHIVPLTDTELAEYVLLSKKLFKFFDSQKGGYKPSDAVTRLLLQRKRIIQKAYHKLEATQKILKERFDEKGHLKYSFVYVPEGFSTENDATSEDEVDARLLHEYVEAIAQIDPSVSVESFTSQTNDREALLKSFKLGNVQVLAAMKCLDEGVDIPRTELAIFCASTGNPRQFIQRRGRVLRTHGDKHLATIHDLIVVPFSAINQSAANNDTFSMERSLVRKELERVAHFASLSINEYHTHQVLEQICDYYELSLHAIQQTIKN